MAKALVSKEFFTNFANTAVTLIAKDAPISDIKLLALSGFKFLLDINGSTSWLYDAVSDLRNAVEEKFAISKDDKTYDIGRYPNKYSVKMNFKNIGQQDRCVLQSQIVKLRNELGLTKHSDINEIRAKFEELFPDFEQMKIESHGLRIAKTKPTATEPTSIETPVTESAAVETPVTEPTAVEIPVTEQTAVKTTATEPTAIETAATKSTTVSLDATAVINKAIELIESSGIGEQITAISLLTGRRQTEVGAAMSFQASNEYLLKVSCPIKKPEKDWNDEYIIVSLADSVVIEEKVQNIRESFDIPHYDFEANFGNRIKANEQFNNRYKFKILAAYDEIFREFLNSEASMDEETNYHKLRAIYASIALESFKIIHNREQKYEGEILGYVKQLMCHESSESTLKYITWNVVNIPKSIVETFRKVLENIKTIGVGVQKKEVEINAFGVDINSLIDSDFATRHPLAYELWQEKYSQFVGDPRAMGRALKNLLIDATSDKRRLVKTLESNRLSGDEKDEKIANIINCVIDYNKTSKTKIQVNASIIRKFHQEFIGNDVNSIKVQKVIDSISTEINDSYDGQVLEKTANHYLRGDKLIDIMKILKNKYDADYL